MRTHRIVALAGVAVVLSGAGCGSEDGYVSMGADATSLSSGGTASGGQVSSTGGKVSSTGGMPSSTGGSAPSGGMAGEGTAGAPGENPGPAHLPISVCPDELPPEDTSVVSSEIDGDRLTVTVQYRGGCESHEVTLCYDPSFGDSNPPSVSTHFLHDAKGDRCNARIIETLTFDLSPLSAHGHPLLQTEFGIYASGELSCLERALLGQWRLNERSRQQRGCSEDADCVQVSDRTGCSSGCGSTVNASAVDAWEATRSQIDEEFCGRSFSDAGCGPLVAACLESVPACVEGQCQLQGIEP